MQHGWYLGGAIALEIAGTTSMKLSLGFSRRTPSVLLFVFYLGSIIALTLALQKIEVSIAYGIWSGVGTASIAVIGMLSHEAVSTNKLVSIALIVIGVIGANLGGAHH